MTNKEAKTIIDELIRGNGVKCDDAVVSRACYKALLKASTALEILSEQEGGEDDI